MTTVNSTLSCPRWNVESLSRKIIIFLSKFVFWFDFDQYLYVHSMVRFEWHFLCNIDPNFVDLRRHCHG